MTDTCFWTDWVGCAEDTCGVPVTEVLGRMNLVGANYVTFTYDNPKGPNNIGYAAPDPTAVYSPSTRWGGADQMGDVSGLSYVTDIPIGKAHEVLLPANVFGNSLITKGSHVHLDIPTCLIYDSAGPYYRPPIYPGKQATLYILLNLTLSAYFMTSDWLYSGGFWQLTDDTTGQQLCGGWLGASFNSGQPFGWANLSSATDFTVYVCPFYDMKPDNPTYPFTLGRANYPKTTLSVDLYLHGQAIDGSDEVDSTTVTRVDVYKTYLPT